MKKKLGSLLLALTLALSLSVPALAEEAAPGDRVHPLTGEGAAPSAAGFTDAARIGQWEAVAALTKLGIVKGKDDGSFDPAGPVTRAELASMFTAILLGGEEAELWTERCPSFSDISGHWAEEKIKFCADCSIIQGRGDGIFDPDGEVTGVEIAKMILCALGYEPAVYALTGPDWQLKTNIYANMTKNKLYDGVEELDPNLPASRETAARMLYNALSAQVLKIHIEDRKFKMDGTMLLEAKPAVDKDGNPVSLLNEHFAIGAVGDLPAQPGK